MKEHKIQNCTHHSKLRAPIEYTLHSNLQVQMVHPTFVCKSAHIVQKTRRSLHPPKVDSEIVKQSLLIVGCCPV